MHRPLFLLVLLSLAACTSAPPALRNVPVEYRFENVRRQSGADEWELIQAVLRKHVKAPITSEVVKDRSVGDASFRTHLARIIAPDLAALDAIHADLEALRQTRTAAGRIDFRLATLGATYKSSFVTAGASTVVSGFTVEGNAVRLFTRPGGEAIPTNTLRGGMWSARLEGAPDDRWVYGVSEHPAGALPRRFFRINVSTLQTDNLDEDEFTRWYGRPLPR